MTFRFTFGKRNLLWMALFVGALPSAQAQLPSVGGVQTTASPRPAVPPVDDINAEARRFRDTFTSLSQKYGVAFVMEGVPLKIHDRTPASAVAAEKNASTEWELPESFAAQQLKRLLDRKTRSAKVDTAPQAAEPAEPPKVLSMEERVAEAAAQYDYRVEKRGTIFLLRKRYTNPHDLPDVSLGESAAALKDVTRLLSQWNPNVKTTAVGVRLGGMNVAETSFMASLTGEQEEQMRNGGLKVSAMSPTQQHDVRQIAMFYYIQMPFEDLYGTMAQFDRLLKKKTVLCQKKQDEQWLLGYEDPTGWFGGPWFMPLDQLPVFTPPFPKPTDEAVKAETVWAAQRRAAGATTLGQMVVQVNRRTPSAPKVVVDAILADKTLTLVGEQKLTPPALLKAAADVYGLRFKTDPDGTPHLTRRNVKPPKALEDLPASIASAFPDPFLRALHKEEINQNLDENAELNAQKKAGRMAPAEFERMQELSLRREIWRKHPEQLGMAAIRRLSVRTRPLFQQNPNARHPIADLDGDTKSAIASIVMTQTMSSLQTVVDSTPPVYIEQWEQLGVMGGKFKNEKGQTFYRLYLAVPGTNGKLHTTVGGQTAPFTE